MLGTFGKVSLILLSVSPFIHCNIKPVIKDEKAESEVPDIVTATPEEEQEGIYSTSGEFVSPSEEDMIKFEAFDAISAPEVKDEALPPAAEDENVIIASDLYQSALSAFNSSAGKVGRREAWEMMIESAKLGSSGASIRVAIAQLIGGSFVKWDPEEAKDILLAAAKLGDPEAQTAEAFLHASGTMVPPSPAKALLYYTFGAFGGSVWANMALGYRYWSGNGVVTSCEKALDHYRRAAESISEEISFGGGPALQRVRLQDEIEQGPSSSGFLDNDLIEYYQLLADKGDVQAQLGLGQLHYQGGRGIESDHSRALEYFVRAAEAGNPAAMAFLGKIYFDGSDGVEADNDTALNYFRKSADEGHPVGQSGLGLMYLQGRGVKRDYKMAATYFKRAADQNWVDGQLYFGFIHYRGLGVPVDYKVSLKYFNLASQSGHVLGFYYLAEMHALGTGVLRSCPTAVELYKNVAERGTRAGELIMEAYEDYRKGRLDQSLIKYLFVAELGYEIAQSNAAFIFDRWGETDALGKLFPPEDSRKKALVYFARAAMQGSSGARVRLGDYYYYGWGTETDFEAAADHYRIASEQQNNAQAMFNLGYMHELGLGMPQDFHLAKRFYDMAAETSSDAIVPVTMALIKLGVTYAMGNWSQYQIIISPDTLATFQLYWDLYLLTILLGLLFLLIFARRNNNVNRRPATVPSAASHPTPNAEVTSPAEAAGSTSGSDDAGGSRKNGETNENPPS